MQDNVLVGPILSNVHNFKTFCWVMCVGVCVLVCVCIDGP